MDNKEHHTIQSCDCTANAAKLWQKETMQSQKLNKIVKQASKSENESE